MRCGVFSVVAIAPKLPGENFAKGFLIISHWDPKWEKLFKSHLALSCCWGGPRHHFCILVASKKHVSYGSQLSPGKIVFDPFLISSLSPGRNKDLWPISHVCYGERMVITSQLPFLDVYILYCHDALNFRWDPKMTLKSSKNLCSPEQQRKIAVSDSAYQGFNHH